MYPANQFGYKYLNKDTDNRYECQKVVLWINPTLNVIIVMFKGSEVVIRIDKG